METFCTFLDCSNGNGSVVSAPVPASSATCDNDDDDAMLDSMLAILEVNWLAHLC